MSGDKAETESENPDSRVAWKARAQALEYALTHGVRIEDLRSDNNGVRLYLPGRLGKSLWSMEEALHEALNFQSQDRAQAGG